MLAEEGILDSQKCIICILDSQKCIICNLFFALLVLCVSFLANRQLQIKLFIAWKQAFTIIFIQTFALIRSK